MTFSVKTIPDMLVEAYGNQTEVARRLKCSRGTVRKYVDDKDGKMHAIVNDVCNQVNHLIPTRVLVKGGEITCKILK